MSDADQYIPVEQVAAILGVTIRQASRYASKVRTERRGQRIFYHLDDIREQARLRGKEHQASIDAHAYRPAPQAPKAELMPPGEMLNYLRERDAEVRQLQQQLLQAARRIGELEATLQQRLLPDEANDLQRRLIQAEAERDALRTILDLERQQS